MHTDRDSSHNPSGTTATAPVPSLTPLLIAAGVGGAVAIALGTYGRVHSPTGEAIVTFGFPAVLPMKAWVTTGAATLGLAQLATALWMWGRLPFAGAAPSGLGATHRWLGTAAFVLTLPVAYHCLWSLGFQSTSTRVLLHSVLGCLFYGAFVTKMLVLRSERLPGWALPAAGGLLVTTLSLIWTTSSLWFFTEIGFPGI